MFINSKDSFELTRNKLMEDKEKSKVKRSCNKTNWVIKTIGNYISNITTHPTLLTFKNPDVFN